ncbi:MAG: hypothetical protein R3B46_00130 [Phycisphaerales bacterium]|nr:hypothetical protein [Phycisphaerales bacterium]
MRTKTIASIIGVVSLAWGGSAASAALTVVEQTGTLTVEGLSGTVVAHAPAGTPWNQTIASGGSGLEWYAQSFLFTGWSASSIIIYPEAIASPGSGAPVLTQSFSDVKIRFNIDEPMTIDPTFLAGPDFVGPENTLNEWSIRLVRESDGAVIIDGVWDDMPFTLEAGDYRLESRNDVGNTAGDLTLSESARMLTVQLGFAPAPACIADITGPGGVKDGEIGVDDLNAILSSWGATVGVGSPIDIAGNDGVVDVNDLNVILSNWGACG